MPVEIRELVIQACLAENAKAPEDAAKGGNDMESQLRVLEQKVDMRFHQLRRELLQECIDEVLEILEEKQRILR